jgi:predicted kinase
LAEAEEAAMLVVFGGLPGVGKSTIAAMLARRLLATYLRIDTIEQALRACATLPGGVVAEGYAVAYLVAEENLRAGGTVVADSVNPLPVTRDAWLAVANRAHAPVLEVEIVCSDAEEHRRRVETRRTNVSGLTLPVWDEVLARDYQRWDRPHVILDTAARIAEDTVEELLAMPLLRARAGLDAAAGLATGVVGDISA